MGWQWLTECLNTLLYWVKPITLEADEYFVAGDNRTELVARVGALIRTPRWVFGLR